MKGCIKCGFKPNKWGNCFPEIDTQVAVLSNSDYFFEFQNHIGRVIDVIFDPVYHTQYLYKIQFEDLKDTQVFYQYEIFPI